MSACGFKPKPTPIVRILCTISMVLALGAASAVLIRMHGADTDVLEASEPSPSPPPEATPRLVVAIDPGHGLPDGGATGTDTGIAEEGINLLYALTLSEELRSLGMDAVLTRTDENALDSTKQKDMARRVDIINSCGADAAISIHMNKFKDRSVSGPMAFYDTASAESEELAKSVLDNICSAIDRPTRIVNPGDYYITKNSRVPTVILECGFLSNSADEALLTSEEYMRTMMHAAAQGIRAYLCGEE